MLSNWLARTHRFRDPSARGSCRCRLDQRGFSLMEVLIVVVILSVLAAAVLPQFRGEADDERNTLAEYNLATIRSVIQTYRAEHHGDLPSFSSHAVRGLICRTTQDGTVDDTGAYGPYLPEMPENPFTGKTLVTATSETTGSITSADVTADNAGGWLYNPSTGEVFLDSDPGYRF